MLQKRFNPDYPHHNVNENAQHRITRARNGLTQRFRPSALLACNLR